MLVSTAIVYYGLKVKKFYMLNAAIPIEAFSGYIVEEKMINPLWRKRGYSERLYASNWHRLFGEEDGRSKLTWVNIFGNIPNAYNYYSSEDQVLKNSDGTTELKIKDVITDNVERVWAVQEMVKGTDKIAMLPGVNAQGGWGINSRYIGMTAEEANKLSDEELRKHPFFRPFDNKKIMGEEGSKEVDTLLKRARILAEGIPSLSYAAGANEVRIFKNRNIDMAKEFKSGQWPKNYGWKHSAIKEIGYPYNHKLYDNIAEDLK